MGLKVEASSGVSPYINANYILDPYNPEPSKPVFIATQGPISKSVGSFWTMVEQEKAEKIIMLCGMEENGRIACHQYYPDQPGKSFKPTSDLEVTLDNVNKDNSFYWVRNFQLKNLKLNTTRKITQYHSVGWPDRKIPPRKDYKNLQILMDAIKPSSEENIQAPSRPAIIHCSAGIGRTGTLMSLYFLTGLLTRQRASKSPLAASPFATVRNLKEQRFGAVQTLQQYAFIYEYLNLWLKQAL